MKIINEYRRIQGDSPLACVQIDTSYESPDNLSPDYTPWNTANLSETCRNFMLVRDSILKDMQIQSQQEERERENVLSIPPVKSFPPLQRDQSRKDLV